MSKGTCLNIIILSTATLFARCDTYHSSIRGYRGNNENKMGQSAGGSQTDQGYIDRLSNSKGYSSETVYSGKFSNYDGSGVSRPVENKMSQWVAGSQTDQGYVDRISNSAGYSSETMYSGKFSNYDGSGVSSPVGIGGVEAAGGTGGTGGTGGAGYSKFYPSTNNWSYNSNNGYGSNYSNNVATSGFGSSNAFVPYNAPNRPNPAPRGYGYSNPAVPYNVPNMPNPVPTNPPISYSNPAVPYNTPNMPNPVPTNPQISYSNPAVPYNAPNMPNTVPTNPPISSNTPNPTLQPFPAPVIPPTEVTTKVPTNPAPVIPPTAQPNPVPTSSPSKERTTAPSLLIVPAPTNSPTRFPTTLATKPPTFSVPAPTISPTRFPPTPATKPPTFSTGVSDIGGLVSGLVWKDDNVNGIKDDDESGVQGVPIILCENIADGICQEMSSDTQGFYRFRTSGSTSSSFFVALDLPEGFSEFTKPKTTSEDDVIVSNIERSDATSGATFPFPAVPSTTEVQFNAGLVAFVVDDSSIAVEDKVGINSDTGLVQGLVWADKNANGIRDNSSENGKGGVEVFLCEVDGGCVTVFTGEDGSFELDPSESNSEQFFIGVIPPLGQGFSPVNIDNKIDPLTGSTPPFERPPAGIVHFVSVGLIQ